MTRIALAVVGDGKMGRAVAALAPEAGFEVVALLGAADVAAAGITPAVLNGATMAIEFTEPSAAAVNVRQCLAAGCAVVCGTTGWDDERRRIEDAVRGGTGTFLWAPNFSLGVHLFTRITEYAARLVAQAGAGFDTHLLETHHSAKVDAPSGTALALADTIREAGGTMRREDIRSTREGDVVGHHRIELIGPGETLVLEPDGAGPDLARLLVGSEGTLAITTEATLAVEARHDVNAIADAFYAHLERTLR